MNDGFSLTLTPTVGTAGYIAGDGVGGILDFGAVNGLSGDFYEIQSIHISDKSKSHPALFIELFKATPASGTYTDSSPLVYGTGDAANSIGVVSLLATDWADLPRVSATYSKITVNGLQNVIVETGSHIFALIHADSSFSLTNGDLIISISGRQL